MKLLLDTCTFLWINADAPDLSEAAREAFTHPSNIVYLSAVSSWEIMVKHALGKLPLPEAPANFIRGGRQIHRITPLPLSEQATWHLADLPDLHRDPFDRMLICQAIAQDLCILTPDPLIRQYPVATLW